MAKNDIIEEQKNNVHDIEELAYFGSFQKASNLLINWQAKAQKANSENTLKELTACADALARIGIYVSQMQTRQREYDVQLSRFRVAKLEADAKAKKAIQDLEDYKLQL